MLNILWFSVAREPIYCLFTAYILDHPVGCCITQCVSVSRRPVAL